MSCRHSWRDAAGCNPVAFGPSKFESCTTHQQGRGPGLQTSFCSFIFLENQMIALYVLGLVVTFYFGVRLGMTDTPTLNNQLPLTTEHKAEYISIFPPLPSAVLFRKGAHIRKMLKQFEMDNGVDIYSGDISTILGWIAEAETEGYQSIDLELLQEFKEKLMAMQATDIEVYGELK